MDVLILTFLAASLILLAIVVLLVVGLNCCWILISRSRSLPLFSAILLSVLLLIASMNFERLSLKQLLIDFFISSDIFCIFVWISFSVESLLEADEVRADILSLILESSELVLYLFEMLVKLEFLDEADALLDMDPLGELGLPVFVLLTLLISMSL